VPKFTGGIGAFIAGVILTLVHFPAHAMKGTVSPELMRHLVLIYLPITVTMSLLSIAPSASTGSTGEHEHNLETLREAAATAAASHGWKRSPPAKSPPDDHANVDTDWKRLRGVAVGGGDQAFGHQQDNRRISA